MLTREEPMGWVDADAHVVESPRTWDYLQAAEQKYRPALFDPQDNSGRQHWVIDGKIRGLFRFTFSAEDLAKKSEQVGRNMTTSMETRDVENVGARVRHMDELGIDIQILYPSIFLDQCTERPEVDVALCGAYNRWLADIWRQEKAGCAGCASFPSSVCRTRWINCGTPERTAPAASLCARSKDHGT